MSNDTLFDEEKERKLGWGVILDFEWHIPWPTEWDMDKKVKATEKLVGYITDGTVLESRTRMRVTGATVVQPFKDADPSANLRKDPFIRYRLEH